MWAGLDFSVDLVTFTVVIINRKVHFLRSISFLRRGCLFCLTLM